MAKIRNSAYSRTPMTGLDDLTAVLKGLPSDMRGEIVASPLRKGAKLIETFAKGIAARRTGALSRSITTVMRKYRGGVSNVAVIGPEKNYRGPKGDRPSKYAHLVEFGHRVAKGGALTRLDGRGRQGRGKVGGFVPPKPFMRPAVATYTPVMPTVLAHGIREGMEKAIKKRVKKGTHVR